MSNSGFSVQYLLLEVLVVYFISLLSNGASVDKCLTKRIECEQYNSTKKLNKVCGTNNVTYQNYCYLAEEMCKIDNLSMLHQGRCRTKKPCFRVLRNLQKGKKSSPISYVPTCLDDGRYAPVQCHKQTGYCWCVTSKGRPVPNTSKRHQKPNCTKRMKTRRRANNGRHNCSRAGQQTFVSNLLNIFKSEYGFVKENIEIENKVIAWKFESLDVNSDDVLQRHEYRQLKKLKRTPKPKKCFKSFTRMCDLDRDMKISRDEWGICLSKDLALKSSASFSGQLHTLESKRKDEPESNDCLSDRQAVLTDQRANDLYVPECTSDGRYQQIQCYKSTGYCWCVNEDDGEPIPGTSVKDQVPKCDTVPAPVRPMKGCPGEKKVTFFKELHSFLEERMNGSEGSVAARSFTELDVNGSKFLERKEWKTFRALVAGVKTLRRCGKKLPKYCDINNDHKISVTEWFNCLDVQSDKNVLPANLTISPTSPTQKRKGPNPLQSWLKDDD